MENMVENFNNCPAKIHIDNIEKEIEEVKADLSKSKEKLFDKIDGVNKLLIGGFSGTIFSIIVSVILFLIFRK